MIKGIYGVNIAVEDLNSAIKTYEGLLNIKPTKMLEETDFAFPGLKGAAFNVGGVVIQLISSITDNTSIAKFLKTKGEGLFLISLKTDDIEKDMQSMSETGASFVMDKPKRGDFGAVNFIHPKSAHGVQIELYNPDDK